MYIKVFPRGEGCGDGPVGYATREDDPRTGQLREVAPVVVKGDPENTRRLIDSIDRKWKYTSGVCSWAPGEVVTPEQEKQFIKEFEAVAFAGLRPDQYDCLWIRHGHAGHHELHYISPRMELTTGKAYNAFAPGWQKHFDPLRDRWNIANGWARPDDPARARLIQPGKLAQYSSDKKEIIAAVHQYVLHEVTEGRVNNRQELIASLTEAGLEVTREGKDYVTISDESGKRHRLKGAIYESTFDRGRFVQEVEGEDGGQPGRDRADYNRQLAELDRELEQIREKRAQYNQGRYQTANRSHRADLEPGPGTDPDRSPGAPEKAAALAAPAADLGDHLSRELGDGAITDMVDRTGSSRQASGHPDNAGNFSQRPDLGDPDERDRKRPVPDLAQGVQPGDGLHPQGRQASRQDQIDIDREYYEQWKAEAEMTEEGPGSWNVTFEEWQAANYPEEAPFDIDQETDEFNRRNQELMDRLLKEANHKGETDHGNRKPNIAKPGSSPPPRARGGMQHLSELGVVHDPRPSEMLLPGDVPCHVRQLEPSRDSDRVRRPTDRELSPREKEQYKQSLIQKLINTDQQAGLWRVRWVDRSGRWIDFKDGSRLEIGDRTHTARGMSDGLAAKRLIAANVAAGWKRIGISGNPRFVRLCALEALKNGIEPVPSDAKQARIINKVKEAFERDRAREAVDRSLADNAAAARRTDAAVESASKDLESASNRIAEGIQRPENDLKPRLEAVMNNELDEMKRINIADYLVSQGYAQNKAKSSRNALCYDHPAGDRLIVGTDSKSGHSVYYSVRDDQDNGTIIDLIQKRQALNLGQVRKELRPWIGRGPAERPEIQPQPRPEPTTKDRAEQARGLAACEQIRDRHKYLETRGLSPETLLHFRTRVYTDTRGNAVFPHFDAQGVSGLEIKNAKFTGFSAGGEKGLWLHGPADPARVVVCESAIDCMSHYQLDAKNPIREKTLYVSTAGKMSPEARANLQTLLDRHQGAEITAGFDNDADGNRYTGELQEMAGEREIIRHMPHKKDWNEDLQLQRQLEEERERRRQELEDEQDYGPSM